MNDNYVCFCLLGIKTEIEDFLINKKFDTKLKTATKVVVLPTLNLMVDVISKVRTPIKKWALSQ